MKQTIERPVKKKGEQRSAMTAEAHRLAATKLQARARLHHAKADILDADSPPAKSKDGTLKEIF